MRVVAAHLEYEFNTSVTQVSQVHSHVTQMKARRIVATRIEYACVLLHVHVRCHACMLQCVAGCCRVLQRIQNIRVSLRLHAHGHACKLHGVAVCSSALLGVAVRCDMFTRTLSRI